MIRVPTNTEFVRAVYNELLALGYYYATLQPPNVIHNGGLNFEIKFTPRVLTINGFPYRSRNGVTATIAADTLSVLFLQEPSRAGSIDFLDLLDT